MSFSLKQLLKSGENKLLVLNIEDADFEAMQMLLASCEMTHTEYYLNSENPADSVVLQRFEKMLERRIQGEPLQYVLGEWNFYTSVFKVGKGVLIPRPETEQLVDICVSEIRKNGYKTVFDLCSGSGCIGISIAKECPETQVFLFELFDEALKYTRTNAQNSELNNLQVVKLDVLNDDISVLPKTDLLVSNPPYIPSAEINTLQSEVLREPLTALDGGEDGLIFYKCIADKWLDKLNDGGFVAVECGEEQSEKIADMFSDKLLPNQLSDIFGVMRFVSGVKK